MDISRLSLICALCFGIVLGHGASAQDVQGSALPPPETLTAPGGPSIAVLPVTRNAIQQIVVPVVDGPTIKKRGEYVRLAVRFDEKSSAAFMPVDAYDWGQDPIIEYDADGIPVLVGRVCSFSIPCDYDREELSVMCSWYATIGDRPDVQMVRHTIKIQGAMLPPPAPPTNPNVPPDAPPVPPTTPTNPNEPGGPVVPIPALKITTTKVTAQSRDDALLSAINALSAKIEGVRQYESPIIVPSAPKIVTSRVITTSPMPSMPSAQQSLRGGGGRWNINGDWSPSKSQTIAHLRSTHSGTARMYEPLEQWSYDQLRALHDDSHEGRVNASIGIQRMSLPAGGSPCPGGVCPAPGSSGARYGVFGFRRR